MAKTKHGLSAIRAPFLGLALACVWSGNLHADLEGRLGVLANALAASGAAAGRPVALLSSGPDGSAPNDPLALSLVSGMRRALSATAVAAIQAEGNSGTADALVLVLHYQAVDSGLDLHAELHAAADPAVLWSRRALIPRDDLPAGSLPGPALDDGTAGQEDLQAIPGPPRDAPMRRPLHWDLSLAYKAFLPLNSSFRAVAGGRLDGLSLGVSFCDIFLADLDAYHADLSGQGSLQSLDYEGVDLAVVAPLHLGPATLYAGPGGRFGSIYLNDSSLPQGSVSFGNNAFMAVAGVKAAYRNLGLDFRYGYDFTASYTGYHSLRLGGYYAFGR